MKLINDQGFFFPLVRKLHTHPVRLEPTTPPSIPLIWNEGIPFELELIGLIKDGLWQTKAHSKNQIRKTQNSAVLDMANC